MLAQVVVHRDLEDYAVKIRFVIQCQKVEAVAGKTKKSRAGVRVSLVEDHPVLRDVLRDYILRLPQVETCTVVATAEAALEDLDDCKPDLMLIDLSLPGMSGIDLVRELRKAHPAMRCAILSGHRSLTYANDALAAGANGYLLKGDPLEIERGMRAILAGESYVSEALETGH